MNVQSFLLVLVFLFLVVFTIPSESRTVANQDSRNAFSSPSFYLTNNENKSELLHRFARSTTDSKNDTVKKEASEGSMSKLRTTVFFFIYGFLVLLAFIGFLVWRLRRSKNQAKKRALAFANIYGDLRTNGDTIPDEVRDGPLNDIIDFLPYKKEFEIAEDKLIKTKEKKLGSGNFGVVYKGNLKMADPKTIEEEKKLLPVAFKVAANSFCVEQTSMLASELKLMCAIGRYPNVLALVGAVTVGIRKGQLRIVTEYIDCGNLRDYLREHKDNFKDHLVEEDNMEPDYLKPFNAKRKIYVFNKGDGEEEVIKESLTSLTTSDLLSFGLQIANGMQYLASINLVHRDLALRNVLLKSNKTIRIADFGMARKHMENKNYYKTQKSKDVPVPIRWMSPEAVESMRFTQKSDVWSYGICLYEIFSLAGYPYPNIGNNDVLEYMKNGGRCSQPDYCHEELYKLMKLCWNLKPDLRPDFTKCVEQFVDHMERSAGLLLQHVNVMLGVEAKYQKSLDDWIRKDRSDIV